MVNRKIKKKGIRQAIYSEKIVDAICTRLSKGESLRSICRDQKMPHIDTVLTWLYDATHTSFQKRYDRAREMQADVIFEEAVEIADDASGDSHEEISYDKEGNEKVKIIPDHQNVQRARLRVDTRKWFLARMAPKKYGDKMDITTGGEKMPSEKIVFLPNEILKKHKLHDPASGTK